MPFPNRGGSIRIYYSGNKFPTYYVTCWCTRWDEGSWDVTIEAFMDSSSRDKLFANVTPGSIREYNNPLGWVINLDGTYFHSSNTLRLEPISGYGISGLRSKKTIVVKNISDTFLNPNYFGVKIEGKLKKDWSDYV